MKRNLRKPSDGISLRIALYIGLSIAIVVIYSLILYLCLRNCGVISILEKSSADNRIVMSVSTSGIVLFSTVVLLWILLSVAVVIFTKRLIDGMAKSVKEATDANEAKNAFIANISHEIRTPMNAVLGFSEIILQSGAGQEINEYANDIKRASNNLLAIINDLLDISKIESGKLELIPSGYLVHDLLTDVESVISIPCMKKGIEFRTDISPELPSKLQGDVLRIRQVLINVINNAIKYTAKGSVELKACVVPIPENNRYYGNAEYVMLKFQVIDTGIGIRKEDLDKIFDKFQQVDYKKNRGIEGTGLGLSISRQLVELMGGDITVDSVYGEGSTFTIYICQKVLDNTKLSSFVVKQQTSEVSNVAKRMYAPGAQVLVVDDNNINIRILTGLLKHFQIEADSADSGLEALNMISGKNYDIVLLDHMMPEMDGVVTVHHIREMQDEGKRNVKVIVVSANAIRGAEEEYLAQGFDDYLSKPVESARLETILRKYLPGNLIIEEDVSDIMNESIDIEIPGVDVFAGMMKSGNNAADYLDVLRIVYDTADAKREELTSLIENEDYENYTIKVHALKSVASSIGAHGVFTMAKIHELAGKNGRYDFLKDNFDALMKLYDSLIENIGAALKDKGLL